MGQDRCLALWVLVASFFCSSSATGEDLSPRVADVKIPYGFQVCTINDPYFERCLLKAAEQNRIILSNGYPEFRIPPLNPIYIEKILVKLDHAPLFSVEVEQTDIRVDYHFDSFLDVHLDVRRRVLSVVALFSEMHVRGQHTTVGESKFGPIRGSGPIHTTFEQLTTTFEVSYSLYQRNGREHMHLDKLRVILEPEFMYVDIDGILPSIQSQNMVTSMLNRDWRRYFGPALPKIEKQLGTVLKEYIEGLFYNLPYRTLFPE